MFLLYVRDSRWWRKGFRLMVGGGPAFFRWGILAAMRHLAGEILRNAQILLCLSLYLAGSSLQAQSPDTAVLQQYSAEGQKALAAGDYLGAERAFEKVKT